MFNYELESVAKWIFLRNKKSVPEAESEKIQKRMKMINWCLIQFPCYMLEREKYNF